MDTALIEKKFQEMGARVKVSEPRFNRDTLSVDVRKDKLGEYFEIIAKKEVDALILDVQKKDRHLLLMTKDTSDPKSGKSKFLCGHDERAWFTCAIPESRKASTVFEAKEALKPKILTEIERKEGLKRSIAQKRHRKLKSGRKIHRQGEFMFIPEPEYQAPNSSLSVILKNEPMRRGNSGNSHYAEYLYRQGGITVYVGPYNSKSASVGLTEAEYREAIKKDSKASKYNWQTMKRDPTVYVKGRITHKEHKTVDLGDVWHRVVLNTESEAKAAKHVVFID